MNRLALLLDVEPCLAIVGIFVAPATLGILFVPAWFQFLFNLVRAVVERKSQVVRDARTALLTANASMFFTLSFLPHQMLLSLDAVARTLVELGANVGEVRTTATLRDALQLALATIEPTARDGRATTRPRAEAVQR